ncbi:glycosyltransferase family 4 protein [Pseudomonas sp. zbq_18]|uniref:MraY family glycosyltransferase n=1 Tax=Pseudomonas sp. zbq_18 TaxID=3367251 RepID=UPI00370C888F
MTLLLMFFFVGSASWLGTWLLRAYALRRRILDIPNQRSSHSRPTPRGGGMAIVLSFLLTLPILVLGNWLTPAQAIALLGGGGVVALVGFLDDHRHIPARWRLLAHVLSAAWAIYWLGGVPDLQLGDTVFSLGWVGVPLGILYLVWLLNLYNFMDGIDGIAAVEAITTCLSVVAIAALIGSWQLALLPALLATAVAGFLYWNFPPAKIFMGDAGSGFLGFILGVLSLLMAWERPELLFSWLILLGVFLVDASCTLLRRFLRGEKVYEAHRSHAYQHASRIIGSHLPVTLAVALINLCWLLPLAIWVALGGNAVLLLILAYLPLLGLAFKYRAGLGE